MGKRNTPWVGWEEDGGRRQSTIQTNGGVEGRGGDTGGMEAGWVWFGNRKDKVWNGSAAQNRR